MVHTLNNAICGIFCCIVANLYYYEVNYAYCAPTLQLPALDRGHRDPSGFTLAEKREVDNPFSGEEARTDSRKMRIEFICSLVQV